MVQYIVSWSPQIYLSATRVRAAYPSQMTYGNVTVLFNYASDPENLRRDNPVDYGAISHPGLWMLPT